MSLKEYPTNDIAYPLMGRRGGRLNWRRLVSGAGRGRRSTMWGAGMRRSRSFFCCCPVFLALGAAGLGVIAGSFYLGIRFLGWA